MTVDKEKALETGAVQIKSKTDDKAVVVGYGVRFGGRDLQGEYFGPDTNFMNDLVPLKLVFYDHTLGSIKHDLGLAKSTIDDEGLWVEAELDRSRQYADMVLELVEEGALGFSSGTVDHLMRRQGKKITQWPIVEFSLTPTPAEPRLLGVERVKTLSMKYPVIKRMLEDVGNVGDAEETGENQNSTKSRGDKMTQENQVTLTFDQAVEFIKANGSTPPVEDLSENPVIKSMSDQINQILEALKAMPSAKDAGYIAPDSEEDHPGVKSLGDFLIAVANNNHKRLTSVYKTIKDTKAALAEDAGVTGGYLVPEEQAAPIFAQAVNFSVLRGAGATRMPMNSRSLKVPKLNIESAPTAGDTAFAGGVVAAWESEAGALDETEPNFKQIELVAHKLGGYTLASNELIADTPQAIESLLTILFGRAVGVKENYAFFRGSGAGEPKGILESGALVSATRSAASAIALADLAKMMANFMPDSWGAGYWFINPAAIEKIIQLVSNPLTWMENLRQGLPVQLLGMPLRPTGALPALNTAGDILLVDPSYYLIGDRQMLSIAFSEHYRFVNDQGTWRFTHRVDGQPWVDGVITLENGSTEVSPFVALAAG